MSFIRDVVERLPNGELLLSCGHTILPRDGARVGEVIYCNFCHSEDVHNRSVAGSPMAGLSAVFADALRDQIGDASAQMLEDRWQGRGLSGVIFDVRNGETRGFVLDRQQLRWLLSAAARQQKHAQRNVDQLGAAIERHPGAVRRAELAAEVIQILGGDGGG